MQEKNRHTTPAHGTQHAFPRAAALLKKSVGGEKTARPSAAVIGDVAWKKQKGVNSGYLQQTPAGQ